ncbi:MAG: hypothetical protein OJI67_22465, partial [Prosthecobacter sp.]|nr:hypothetical protein [Prosthecobacter sp.]
KTTGLEVRSGFLERKDMYGHIAERAETVLRACNAYDELVHAAWFAKMAFTPLDDMLTAEEREQHDNFWMEQHDNAVDREEHPSADKVRQYALGRLSAALAKAEGQ